MIYKTNIYNYYGEIELIEDNRGKFIRLKDQSTGEFMKKPVSDLLFELLKSELCEVTK